MMQTFSLASIALATGLTLALPATAQTGTGHNGSASHSAATDPAAPSASVPAQPGQSGAVTAADRDFMVKAAGSGLYEVEASRSALEHAHNSEVKEFAQQMLTDHEKANQELMALAAQLWVTLPAQVPADKRKELDQLAKAQDFDALYMRTTGLKEHKAAVALFEKASASAKNSELKAWAAQKLPTLRDHLAHAQKIQPATSGAKGSQSAGKKSM